MRPKIILASQSPTRLKLLNIIGIKDVGVIPADIDETEIPNESPKALAKRLSIGKAKKIHSLIKTQEPNAIIIAADSVITVDGVILPKALTDEDVRYCLSMLSNKTHRAYTGITFIHSQSNEIKTKIVKASVTFDKITKKNMDWYIETKEGLNKAGGYAHYGAIQVFCKKISGQISTIAGLPLNETKNMLEDFGYTFEAR